MRLRRILGPVSSFIMCHFLYLCAIRAWRTSFPISGFTPLFYYLKASATREKELHKVQEVLKHPVLKYKEIHAVRWLSCYEAMEAVYRTLDPLISYFHQRKASKDPKAMGLLKAMASTQFIYLTYLLMDVLPIVSRLCLQLQAQDLHVAKAKVLIVFIYFKRNNKLYENSVHYVHFFSNT